jgi:hypothetical protein
VAGRWQLVPLPTRPEMFAASSPRDPYLREGHPSIGRDSPPVGAIDRILRCPGRADHRVPVTANHLPGGKSEPVAKTRTAWSRRSTCPRTTSRSSGRPAQSPKTGSRGVAAVAAKAGHPLAGAATQVKAAIYDHALSVGFGRGFEVDLRGVTDVSSSPDAPKPDRRPEPGRPR